MPQKAKQECFRQLINLNIRNYHTCSLLFYIFKRKIENNDGKSFPCLQVIYKLKGERPLKVSLRQVLDIPFKINVSMYILYDRAIAPCMYQTYTNESAL